MSAAGFRGVARDGAQLAGLCGLAVAQPLFDLLGRNAEFFAARGATRWQILGFALALVAAPPAALLLLEVAAGLVSPRLRRQLHVFLVGVLGGAFVLVAIRRAAMHPALPIAAAAACGAAVAGAYVRLRAARAILTALAAAPLLFLGLFALDSRASKLILAAEPPPRPVEIELRRAPPVVLVVLDELPTVSLMDSRRRIDPVRFPNFADLAGDSTWFRNATTVHEGTTAAVPAILTGRFSPPRRLPVFQQHPQSLLSLLAGAYDLHSSEIATRLCPQTLCRGGRTPFGRQVASLAADTSVVYLHLLLPERLARRLPPVSESWQGFLGGSEDEAARFDRFVRSVESRRPAALHFGHFLLPHSPWRYLPTGKTYRARYARPAWGRDELWSRDEGIVVQSLQRHLLQLAYVDRLLGRLLARLRATGVYDRALVVVTADHGIAFRAGRKRRPAWPANLHDIAFVPLFVKAPHQNAGRVDDRLVRTIDVLPTIASIVGARPPWPVDGRSVFAPRRSAERVVVVKDGGERLSAPLATLGRRRDATLRRQLALFGSKQPASALYGVGRYRALLHRAVDVAPLAVSSGTADVVRQGLGLHVRLTGSAARAVAVIAGGRVVAVAPVHRRNARLLARVFGRPVALVAVSGSPAEPTLAVLRGRLTRSGGAR